MDILTALRASKLFHAKEAASALAGGWVVEPYEEISSAHLERVYLIRHDHLLSKPGLHAQQLADSVGEFVTGLRANIGCSVQPFEIRGPAEHHFLVFCTEDNVIGCIRPISQLDVSEARWQELQSAP